MFVVLGIGIVIGITISIFIKNVISDIKKLIRLKRKLFDNNKLKKERNDESEV